MKYALILLSLMVFESSYGQTDTLYYDPASGNYVIRYLGTTAGNQDTMVTLIYEPPKKIDPKIEGFVWPSTDGKYLYRYRITNGTQAQQNLNEFSLHYDSSVWIESRTPETSWRNSAVRMQDFSDLENPKQVSTWIWNGDQGLEATWYVDSCIVLSDGLPSITDSYSQAKRRIWAWPAGGPNQKDTIASDIRMILLGLDVYPNANVLRKTICPRLPPTPFNGLNFLDTIKSYINQSRSLGWITKQATANKYTRLIDSARSNLQAKTPRRAATKARLDEVLVNVRLDSATTLTSEAYALLRFNTEYVVKKLREEDSAFASENKSSSWNATATNSARHLAKSGEYLHEVFTSGGEIFYRRSQDGGASWDYTHRINVAVGINTHPCITVASSTSIHIVWQRQTAEREFEVWHSYSQDNGGSFSVPKMLPNAEKVEVSRHQTEGPMPVIAALEGGFLLVVYCSIDGLRYRFSDNDGESWKLPGGDIIGGGQRIQRPSLSASASYLSLLYDYADEEQSPFSRVFDGSSWSGETSVANQTGTACGVSSSAAMDADWNPIAAWSGMQPDKTRSIVFRAGYPDNTWSDWFVQFTLQGDEYYPSLASMGAEAIAIIGHASKRNQVYLIEGGPLLWALTTLSPYGAWASITGDYSPSASPIYCWTDQYSFPHEIVLGSSSQLSQARGSGLDMSRFARKRRTVVYHRSLRATFTVEFEPMKIVTTNGDTTLAAFKPASLRERGINFSNMWDYLGSDTVRLPSNAQRLIIGKQFTGRGPSIAQRKFFLRLLNTDGTPIGVLDTTSTSGTVSVNIALHAGKKVIFRPQVVLIGITPPSVAIGVGDVFIVPELPSKPGRGKR